MSIENRVLRAAVALGTAAMLSVVGVSAATAQPEAPAAPSGDASVTDTAADIAAIKQLKTNYFANVDAKNWDALRELLAPDVVVDTTGSAGPYLVGRDPFIAFLKVSLALAKTKHQGFDPDIKVTSANNAEGNWRMEDILIFGGTLGVHGYGNYQDRYTKVNGKWVLKYSKLTRTRFDLIKPDGTLIEANVPIERIVQLVLEITGQK